MNKQTISIAMRHQTSEAIQATIIENTPFAYHLRLYGDEESVQEGPDFCITHLPTGLQLPFSFDDPEHCERFVSLLMKYEQRWERPDYTTTMKRLCKQTYDKSCWMKSEAPHE